MPSYINEKKKSTLDISTEVGGLILKTPIIAASGTFAYGQEYKKFTNLLTLGGIVTKGISINPRKGNPPSRIYETNGSMLNTIGLANIGIAKFLKEKLPFLNKLYINGVAIIVNLYAESIREFVKLASILDNQKGISALEINISCPNVKYGGIAFGTNPNLVKKITKAITNVTDLPVWIKLTPNITDPITVAKSALESGAKAISLVNTILGMAINIHSRRSYLGKFYGGLSGPAIKPIGLRMVHQVAYTFKGASIIGIGGISSGLDAIEYILAGANAVQIGTANFIDPNACNRITQEIQKFCLKKGIKTIKELIGSLVS